MASEKDEVRAEASFCDYWPLAVGNEWIQCENPNIFDIEWYYWRITDQFAVNGCDVWEFSCEIAGGFHFEQWKAYMTFAGDGVYVTPNKADTEALPSISGGFYLFMPRIIVNGTPFTLRLDLFFNITDSATITPRVTYEEVQLLPGGLWSLGRSHGPRLFFSNRDVIVGGCGGMYDVAIQVSKTWYEEGDSLDLALQGDGSLSGVTYQWLKDGVPLSTGTGAAYAVEMLSEGHAGAYSCVIAEPGKALHETNRVQIKVFPAGSLPVTGPIGIFAAIGGLLAAAFVMTNLLQGRTRTRTDGRGHGLRRRAKIG